MCFMKKPQIGLCSYFFCGIFFVLSNIFCYGQIKTERLLDSANTLYGKGNLLNSFEVFKSAIDNEKANGTGQVLQPFSEKIAYLYFINGYLEQSENFYRINLRYKLSIGARAVEIAKGLINLGEVISTKGSSDIGLSYFLTAETMLTEIGYTGSIMAEIKSRIGNIYYGYGDYNRALRYMLLAEEISQRQVKEEVYFRIMSYSGISSTYFMCHDYKKALDYYRKLIRISELSESERSQYLSQVAMCYFNLGQNDTADLFFAQSLCGTSVVSSPETFMNYGRYLLSNGDFEKAHFYLEKALKGYATTYGNSHPYTIRAYYHLGEYWLERQNADSALFYLQGALTQLCPLSNLSEYGNPGTGSTQYVRHILPILEKKGAALYLMALQHPKHEEYWLNKSVETYAAAGDWTLNVSASYLTEDSRIFLSRAESDMFSSAIDACWRLYNIHQDTYWIEQAFSFAENGRASALLSALRERNSHETSGAPSSLTDADERLKTAIWQSEKLLLDPRFTTESSVHILLRQRLVELYKAREKLKRHVELNYPAFSVRNYLQKAPSLKEICHVMPTEMAFVEYVCGDSCLYIFYADQNRYELYAVNTDSTFYNDIQKYQQLGSTPVILSTKAGFNNYVLTTFSLYRVLLKPIENMLKDKTRVMISTDANMGALSFDGIIDRLPDTSLISDVDYRIPDYLFKKYAFTYCYSATWLQTGMKRHQVADESFLIFSPDYSEKTQEGTPQHEALSNLDGAREEASQIADKFNGQLFIGGDAEIEVFLSEAPKAGMLHMAMHSETDEKNPLLSKLVFSAKKGHFTYLTAADIYSMKFNASLVVLASCNSGYGKTVMGEGMLSLARAFLYAGSESVVMALWPVNDESSATIMNGFYDELLLGSTTDVALQKAKMKFLDNSGSVQSHPAYWAGYVLNGKGVTVYPSHRSNVMFYIIIGAILILGGMIGLLFSRARKRLRA